jgi:transcriptional regulator with XRE-family HTH domain
MKDLGSKMKDWRIAKVLELSSKGLQQSEIAKVLKVSEPTISRDLSQIRQQSHQRIRRYLDEELPVEYEKTLSGLTQILKETWIIINKADTDERDRLMALSLARDTYNVRLDLLSSATVVERAVRFVENHRSQPQSLTDQNGKVRTDVTADQSLVNTDHITESKQDTG